MPKNLEVLSSAERARNRAVAIMDAVHKGRLGRGPRLTLADVEWQLSCLVRQIESEFGVEPITKESR